MTPMNLNSSPFPEDHPEQFNLQSASSSLSLSCHPFLLRSTQVDHSSTGYNPQEIYKPQQNQEEDNYAYHGESYNIDDKVDDHGLKLTIRKKEERCESTVESDSVKWRSSKIRLMRKIKSSEVAGHQISTTKLEEDQKQPSSSLESEFSSNNYSSPKSNNNHPIIRVCADCNTTKTPLWRSGPKGPKSLCNACGIRQRKARRAMAAAAAAAVSGVATMTHETCSVKIKMQHKDKARRNGQVSEQKKKRCKIMAGPAASDHQVQKKKLAFEDLLINLSKNLAYYHHVFPQDEKDAAILLMALSSGLVHS